MQSKKPYKKPEIARVEMTPEDAVLTACKTSRSGPGRSTWCRTSGTRCVTRKQGS